MILSEIVAQKNLLDTLTVSDIAETTKKSLDSIVEIVNRAQLPVQQQLEDLDTAKFVINNVLVNYENVIESIQAAALKVIEDHEEAYFTQSKNLYENMRHEEVDYILNRTKQMSDNTRDLIDARSKIHTDWRFPGMIIRPGRETQVNGLVALDPLYLVDTRAGLLEPAVTSFTPEYQARVRQYVIEEYTENPIFNNIPKDQLGFVFSHNYFQYKPIDILQSYIKEMFQLLRPGGVFGFTYNDCDFAHAVRLTERHFHCYTPGRIIKQYALDLGYDIVFEYHGEENVHWLELQRPGVKDSIRGGQALAAIVPKRVWEGKKKSKYLDDNTPKTIDIPTPVSYTSDEVLRLQISAILLGIDSEERILNSYTPEKLYRLVHIRMNQGGIEIAKFNEKLERKINKRKKL